MEPFELALLGITAAATSTAAVIGWLTYRARYTVHRYESYNSRIKVDETELDSTPVMRTIEVRPSEEEINKGVEWDIAEVAVASQRKKWLAEIDGTRFDGHTFRVPNIDWKRRIKLDDPRRIVKLILHNDAPEDLRELVISLKVRLIADERVFRKYKVRGSGVSTPWR